MRRNFEYGQVILIVLLVMAVGVTIGLSVANRAVTDVKLSTQVEESNRAFSAAETGIEEVLRQELASVPETFGNTVQTDTHTAKYDVKLSPLGTTIDVFAFPDYIADGDYQTVWLVNQLSTGPDVVNRVYNADSIEICFSAEDATVPAIEVAFFAQDGGVLKIARNFYDPETRGNNFTSVADTSGGYCTTTEGTSYQYRVSIADLKSFDPTINMTINYIPVALRFRPIYSGAYIAVSPQGGESLPEQGKNIVSTGSTDSGVTRKWSVEQHYPAPQDIFDYAVWSGGDLTK